MKKNFNILKGAWCIFTLFDFTNFLAFYYAGFKSKSKKYIFLGHIYLLSTLVIFPLTNHYFRFLNPLVSFLSTAGYFFGIIFAFVTIKAFYKRLQLLDQIDPLILSTDVKKIYSMNNQSLEEFIKNISPVILENNIKTSVLKTSDSLDSGISSSYTEDEYLEYSGEKIKINSASEEKLAELPFITEELIRKIILERKLGNGFRNEKDLHDKLSLNDYNAGILAKRIDFSFENK